LLKIRGWLEQNTEKTQEGAAPGRCLCNRQGGDGDPWWFMKGGGDLRSTEGEKCVFLLASLREIRDPGFVQTGRERSEEQMQVSESG